MNKQTCNKCGTENEEGYLFCKNCGNQLSPINNTQNSNPAEKQRFNSQETNQSFNQGADYSQNPAFSDETIGGVSAIDISVFIGKKANKFLPSFRKMELTLSKTSWCWPLAILTFLFGPIGAALWFFYRKMYKPAVIFTVISAVLSIITAIANSFIDISSFEGIFELYLSGEFETVLEEFKKLDFAALGIYSVIGFILNIINITTFIVTSIFGHYWYMKHCISKINYYRGIQLDPRYYRLGLSSIGGVSGGMLTLGIILMIFINSSADIVTTLISNF